MPAFDFKQQLKDLSLSLTRDEKFAIEKLNLRNKENAAQQLDQLPPLLREFYSQADGYELQWSHEDFPGNRFARGQANIWPLDSLLRLGEGLLWFDRTPPDDPIRRFRIVDYVSDEVFIGIFLNDGKEDDLYFYSISDQPIPLQLNMQGYVAMLSNCRAFKFWQLSVLAIIEGRDSPESENLKSYLPQLVAGFRFADFEKLFSTVKTN